MTTLKNEKETENDNLKENINNLVGEIKNLIKDSELNNSNN